MTRAIITLFFFSTLIGCTDGVLVQSAVNAPSEGWPRLWKPEFTFDVTDTLGSYNTFLDLRHTTEYPYSNLYLFVSLTDPDGNISIDTVECPLAAPDGNWYGKGLGFIHEDRFQAHVLYKMNNRFPKSGRYNMKLEQAMRRETLEGIINIGISVEFVDP